MVLLEAMESRLMLAGAHAPVALADSYALAHDVPLSIAPDRGLLHNDFDLDDDPLTAIVQNSVAHGTLSVGSDGAFTYTPTPGFVGLDQFTYLVNDGTVDSVAATVSLQVTNETPIAIPDEYTAWHDHALNVPAASGLLINDDTAPGETLAAEVVASPAHGTLSLQSNGGFVYTPAAGYLGPDLFTYRISDGFAWSDPQQVRLTVSDTLPVAHGENYFVLHDHTFSQTAAQGVLANETPDPGETLVASLVNNAQYGTLVFNADGSFTYTPGGGYVGGDAFSYRIYDGRSYSDPVEVQFNVTNRRPLSRPDDYFVVAGGALSTSAATGILANDTDDEGDIASLAIQVQPLHGSLSLAADGSFVYTPELGFVGIDSFSYTSSDGILTGDVTEVTLDVTTAAVRTRNEAFTLAHDRGLVVAAASGVLSNDWQKTGASLTAQLITSPTYGALTLNTGGSFTYTASAGFTGADQFTYQAVDGNGQTATGTVSLSIVNHAPIGNADAYDVLQDGSLTVAADSGVAKNDYDDDADALTVTLLSQPAHGTLALNADGSFAYTPNVGYLGSDSFSYSTSDGLASSGPLTATFNVYNNAPKVRSDRYGTRHGTALEVDVQSGVLSNDTDDAGQTITAQLVSGASNGALTLNPDGSFTYTPNGSFAGEDQFTYRAFDGRLYSDNATVTVKVTNRAPRATADTFAVLHGQTLTADAAHSLLLNDADPDADPLVAELVSGPSNGNLTLHEDGTFTYVPNWNYVGPDSFSYRVDDGASESSAVLVSIDVRNQAPLVGNDEYTGLHDRALIVSAEDGLKANDIDPDGDALTIQIVSGPTHGTLNPQQDGSFVYTPGAGYVGSDEFQYTISDGPTTSAPIHVSLDITNQTPVASDSSQRVLHDHPLNVSAAQGLIGTAFDADADALTISIITWPAHGGLATNPDGSYTYTPQAGYVGSDAFVYRLSDGAASSSDARVDLTVTNAMPTANNDYYSTKHGQTLNVAAADGLLANDWDGDAESLTLHVVSSPGLGSVSVAADGSFTYSPYAQSVGADTFTYYVSDGAAQSATRTVTIQIDNLVPMAGGDVYAIGHDRTLTVTAAAGVLANDSDADQDALTVSLLSGPAQGSLNLASDGSFVYTPSAGFVGEVTFTYSATDGVASSTGEVRILVRNNAPVAIDDAYSIAHDRSLNVAVGQGLLANDWDADNDTLAITILSQPAHGSLSLGTGGAFTYTPAAGYVGNDFLTYQVSDGLSPSQTATVRLSVTNQTPLVRSASYQVAHDQTLSINAASGLATWATDGDSDALTFAAGSAAHGTLSVQSNGSFSYTPAAGYVGSDSVAFTATDGIGAPISGTLTLWVTNGAAEGAADNYQTAVNTALVVNAANGVLRNDRQDPGETLTAVVDTSPSHGTLSLGSDGSFTYTPGASYTGSDSFTYRAQDGAAQSAPITVSINVGASAPSAAPDAFLARRNETLAISAAQGVLSNDLGASAEAVLVSGTSNGSLTLNSDGSLSYAPNAGYVGTDSFTYKIRVGGVDGNTVTAAITVTNDAPRASADSYRVQHDHALTVSAAGVLANDSDGNANDTLTAQLVSGAAHGSVALNSDGSFTYTPAAGYKGSDSFTYQASDGQATSGAVTVSIDVWNNAPVSHPDGYRTPHDHALTIAAASGVLANDEKDPDETLSAILVAGPQHGTLTLNSNGSFTYTPAAAYVGFDSFTYKASDGVDQGNTTTVTLDVWNVAPRGTPNIYHIHHDATLMIGAALGVVTNDVDTPGETLTPTLISAPQHAAGFSFFADGSFIYTPAAHYVGVDGFSYSITDGAFTTGPIWVSLDVWNTVPVARPNAYRIHWGQTLTASGPLGALANDYDNDGDALAAVVVAAPTHGNLQFNANGTFTYTPNGVFVGTDSFTYTISDGPVLTPPTTVTIAVENSLPVTSENSYRVHHDGTLTIGAAQGFLADDYDPEADPLTVAGVTQPAHGTLSANADGSFTYTPTAAYVGADSFTYRLSDGAQLGAWTTVNINVWNNIPWVHRNYYSLRRGGSVSGNVLSDDTEWDGDTMQAELVGSGVQHGTLQFSSNGAFTYTPSANYSGSDSFSYRVYDGAQYSSAVTVDIDVLNNAPRGVSDSLVLHHKAAYASGVSGNVLSNDWEPDGETMTAIAVGTLPQGLTLNANGSYTYTLPTGSAHWTGIVSFTYKITDGADESAPVQATIEVYDAAPIALEDFYRTKHGVTLNGNVLTNDFDADDAAADLRAELVNGPSADNGALTLNSDGSFTFVPVQNFAGEVSFTYKVFDGAKYSSAMNVTIMVTNSDPIGILDFYYGVFGLEVNNDAGSGVLKNDLDIDDDHSQLKAILVTPPQHGYLLVTDLDMYRQNPMLLFSNPPWQGINQDGSFVYLPTPGYLLESFGFDSFTYKVTDGISESAPTMVVLTIQKAPQAAYPDNYRMAKGSGSLTVPAAGVLANDWVAGNGNLKAYLASNPANGTVALAQDGSFVYTPNSPTFVGEDSFTYKLGPNGTGDEVATVKIKVVELTPANDTYTIKHDRRLQGSVLGNDAGTPGEPLRAELVGNVSAGTLDFNADGTFLYTPPTAFVGTATFTYRLTNGVETSATNGTVTINVQNTAPVGGSNGYGGGDSYSTSAQRPLVVDFNSGVLANDTDADGDVLKAEIVSGLSGGGSLQLNDDGSFTFIPLDNFKGTATFSYKAKDGVTATTPQTVSITVTDNAPTAAGQSYSVYHGDTLTVGPGNGVLKGASDEFRHQLVAELVSGSGVSHGSLSLASDGSFTYTPTSGYVGPDSFSFRVKDATGTYSSAQTVNITVVNNLSASPWRAIPLNEFRGTLTYTPGTTTCTTYGGYGGYGGYQTCTTSPGSYGGSVSGDAMDVSYDIDGDPLTATLVSGPAGLSFSSDGSFSYSSSNSYGGSFTFSISDGFTTSGPYTVNLYYGPAGTPSTDFELSPGESFYSGGRATGYNGGPGTVLVTGYSSTSISFAPVSGSSFSVSVSNGHANWSGAVSGSLSISAAGDINSISIAGDLSVYAGGNVGDLSGHNVNANGDNIGNITASQDASASTYGGYMSYGGVVKWSASSGVGVVGNVSATRDITNVQGASLGTINAGRNIGTVYGYTIGNTVTSGGSIDRVSASRSIGAAIQAATNIGNTNLYYPDAISAGTDITSNVTAGTYITVVVAGGSITSTISAGTDISSVTAHRSITGTVTAGGNLSTIIADDHFASGSNVHAGAYLGSMTSGWDMLGTISANGFYSYGGYGGSGVSIGNLNAGRDLAGTVTGSYGIGSVTAGRTLSAQLTANTGPINSVTAWDFAATASLTATAGAIGTVSAERNIAGTITAETNIASLNAWRDISATVSAATGIGTVAAGLSIKNPVSTTAGNIDVVTAGENIEAAITAGGNITSVRAGRNITADITAGNDLFRVLAGLAISGKMKATAGDIDYVCAGTDISGDVTAGDDITYGIVAGRNLTGDVTAGDDITSVRAGEHWLNAPPYIGFRTTGGDISESTITAGGSIGNVFAARYNGLGGTIGSATIKSTNEYISSVSADGDIDATIEAKTYISSVGHTSGYGGAGNVRGSIKATDAYIGSVTANFGNLEATVQAGTYITQVTATHNITGKITAGTYIGDIIYNTGIKSIAGDISGDIQAGTDIGGILAGRHLQGTVTAGRDINLVKSGTLGGGNIEKNITATRNLGTVIAIGLWSETQTPSVYTASSLPQKNMDFPPGSEKFVALPRPRPAKPDMATAGSYGNIQGKLAAESIGSVTAFGNIDKDIVTTQTLGSVWALGNIGGKIDVGSGSAHVQSWGKGGAITTHSSGANISLRAYDKITGSLNSAGGISVTGWDSIQGDLKAVNNVMAWAYKDINGKVTSDEGNANVVSMGSLMGDVIAKQDVSVAGSKIFSNKLQSFAKGVAGWAADQMFVSAVLPMIAKIWMISLGNIRGNFWNAFTVISNYTPTMGGATTNVVAFGDIEVDTILSTDVNIYAGKNVKAKVASWGDVDVQGRNVDLEVASRTWPVLSNGWPSWMQSIWGDGYADGVKVQAIGDLKVNLDIGGHADLMTTGTITGEIHAGNFMRSAEESANMKSDQEDSWVAISALVASDVNVKAHSAVTVESWGTVKNTIESGAAIDVMGDQGVSGTLHADGYIQAQSWQDYNATTTSDNGFASLFAAKAFNANVKAKGDVQVEAWQNVSGKIEAGVGYGSEGSETPTAAVTSHQDIDAIITSTHDVQVTALGTLKSQTLKAQYGSAQAEAYTDVAGANVTAGRNVDVMSWGTISNVTATAGDEGSANVWAQDGMTQAKVSAGRDASVSSAADLKATITADKGTASADAIGVVQSGTEVTSKRGGVSITAGGTINATATAYSSQTPVTTQSIEVFGRGKIEGTYTARDSISFTGMDEINATAESKAGGIDAFAKLKLNGTYTAQAAITAFALSADAEDAALQGTYKTTSGSVTAMTLGKFDATINSGGSASVFAAADAAGSVQAASSASVVSDKAVSTTVNAGGAAFAGALEGNVSGSVTSTGSSATVVSSQQITGAVTAVTKAKAIAIGNITGAIRATGGDAEVRTMADLSGNVSASNNADVFAKGTISSTVHAGNNANVFADGAISGDTDAGANASVLTMAELSGSVTAGQNATASAKDNVSGDVTATSGSASVVSGGEISGTIHAGLDVSAFSIGNLSGSVDAGRNADVTTLGEITGDVSADNDATAWAKGAISGPIHAGNNAYVTSYDDVSAAITADTGSADVTVYAGLTGTISAGANATAWVLGDVTGNVSATNGNADVTAVGNITNTISAGSNASALTLGEYQGTINAGGDANVDVFGGAAQVTATTGGSTHVRGIDTVNATITAGGSAEIVSLADATLAVTAQQDADVMTLGTVTGNLTTTAGSASIFATDDVQATVSSGTDATVGAVQAITGTTVTAGGSARLSALGQISASNVTGGDVFVWSYSGLANNTLASPTGSVMALTNGIGNQLTITAAQDATAASLGSSMNASVTAGGSVWLFGFGLTGSVVSGNATLTSFGNLQMPVTVAGSLRAMATGLLTVDGVAGSAALSSYGGILASITTTNVLSAWSLGSIEGTLTSLNDIDTIETWSDLLANVSAADGIRQIHVWGTIAGSITAGNFVNEVYAGDAITGTIAAPMVGWVVVGDRSPFVDLAIVPVAGVGELLAATADAYAQIVEWRSNLLAAQVEIAAAATAAQADVLARLAQALEELASAQTEANARMQDLVGQAQVALAEAQAKTDRALEMARVDSRASRLELQQASAVATAAIDRAISQLQGEATARLRAAQDQRAFMIDNAQTALDYQSARRGAALQQFAALTAVYNQQFVGTFLSKVVEYALDVVQEVLEWVGTFGELLDFVVPGLGSAVGAAADLTNSVIYLARGKYVDALASAAGAIPYAGTFFKAGVKTGAKQAAEEAAQAGSKKILKHLTEFADDVAGAAAKGLSKFVRELPALTADAARRLKCVVTGAGCFVAGTLVVTGELPAEATTVADADSSESSFAANAAVGLMLVGVVGAIALEHRRRRKQHLDEQRALDELFAGGDFKDDLDESEREDSDAWRDAVDEALGIDEELEPVPG